MYETKRNNLQVISEALEFRNKVALDLHVRFAKLSRSIKTIQNKTEFIQNSYKNMYACKIDGCDWFSRKSKMGSYVHMLNEHRKCPKCFEDLSEMDTYEHMETIHGWKIRCEFCDFRHFNRFLLRKHCEKCSSNNNSIYVARKKISLKPGQWIVKLEKLE